jgi:hypothetical protein
MHDPMFPSEQYASTAVEQELDGRVGVRRSSVSVDMVPTAMMVIKQL